MNRELLSIREAGGADEADSWKMRELP